MPLFVRAVRSIFAVVVSPLVAVSALAAGSAVAWAESVGPGTQGLILVGDPAPQNPPPQREVHDPPKTESKDTRTKDLPSIRDLGLNLSSSDLAKRNELDSLSIQPWNPGRGAVGVKVEVTW